MAATEPTPQSASARREIERELEWRKCAKNPIYFIDNYWHIEIIGAGYEIAGLRGYQEEEILTLLAATKGEGSDHQARLKARQIGFTTIACAFAFWDAFFHNHHPWIIAQQAEDDAKLTLAKKVKNPYSMLPSWMRERGGKPTTSNTETLEFENGSSVSAVHSGAASARSRAVYGVIIDEAGFIDDAEALYAALDPLCYGLLIMLSTANGMGNFFHETWLDSQLVDSEWQASFYPWHVVPGRDEQWYATMRRRYRGREWLLHQEYPSDPAEAFSKSGRTAFDLTLLEEEQDWALPELRLDISLLPYHTSLPTNQYTIHSATIPEGEERDFELWVWAKPTVERNEFGTVLRKPNYVMGVDVAEGLEHGDYSAITVYDANTTEEVAAMKARLPVEDVGPLAEWIGEWYHFALIGPERNNQGLVPLQYLVLSGYPRLYRMDPIASQRRGSRSVRYGWHTNSATKPKMVIDFIKGLRDSVVALHDPRFLHEARTFLADGKGGYAARTPNHDDKIISALIGYQMCLDVGQYPTVWVDEGPQPPTFGDVFSLMVGQPQGQPGSSPLYRPLGRGGSATPIERSFILTDANQR